MDFLERVVQLESATNIESWHSLIIEAAHFMGFEQTLLGIVDSAQSPLHEAIILTSYSSIWRDRYDAHGYVDIDPVVAHARSSVRHVIWHDDLYVTPRQKCFLEEAKSFNLKSGVTFPLHGPVAEFGMLSLQVDAENADAEKFIHSKLMEISFLKDSLFQKALGFIRNHKAEPDIILSPREMEILKWSAIGKSTWEISKICNCSEANIDYHIKNIRSKFKVNTRRAAAVKAIALGLITV
ncbi:helix-turn-helix transcriptional regulator [Pseudomonas farris]